MSQTSAGEAVAVIVQAPSVREVAEWIDAVGNVTPLVSVAVQPQVDGRLLRILFDEGQHIERGQLLAQIDPRPFIIARDSAKASLLRDRATLTNAALNAKRYDKLRGQNMVSEQQLTDQQASVENGRAVVLASEAQLSQAQLQLEYADIRSPVAGVAGFRRIDVGNVVRAGSGNALVTINQLSPIGVVFAVPQRLLPALQAARQGGAGLLCLYDQSGERMLGQSDQMVIDNAIDASSGTIRLKAIVQNDSQALWPNQYVKVRLRLRTLPQQVVVPAAAVVDAAEKTVVFLDRDGRAERREVAVVLSLGSEVAITGVGPSDRMIVEGQQGLRQGQPVRVVDAPAAQKPPQKVRGRTL